MLLCQQIKSAFLKQNLNKIKNLYEVNTNPCLFRVAYQKQYNFSIDGFCYGEIIESMNIGKMIEILGEKWYEGLFIAYKKYDVNEIEQVYSNDELCDNLWEEVKTILK